MKDSITAIAYDLRKGMCFKNKLMSTSKVVFLFIIFLELFLGYYLYQNTLQEVKSYSIYVYIFAMLFLPLILILINRDGDIEYQSKRYSRILQNKIEVIKLTGFVQSYPTLSKEDFFFQFDNYFRELLSTSNGFYNKHVQLYFKSIMDKENRDDLEEYHIFLFFLFQNKIYRLDILKKLVENSFPLGGMFLFKIMDENLVSLDEFKDTFTKRDMEKMVSGHEDADFYEDIINKYFKGEKNG